MPSVLAVLVVKDGEDWLRDCLSALARQTHPRIGVVAVDNASTDGSRDILLRALGSGRVISLPRNRGFAAAVRAAALELEVAQEADYLLFLHDDVVLAEDAVERLVEAAEAIEGVGIVGPKVVDWEDPRVLREVGLSTDRFGFPYSPLESDEIDHGQYDRVREVLFVSSCAMLVSRAAWNRAGLPDERFASRFEDLDFCWRARLAGFRVVMCPLARVRHREATVRGERLDGQAANRARYFAERAALAAMLKNYGILSLLWVLPLYAVQGAGRVVLLALSRRFEDVWQVLRAWGWNLIRLPGTIRRRVRAQSVRVVPDRAVRRYMAPATIRLRRWFEIASQILLGRGGGGAGLEELEGAPAALRARAVSLARAHPVAVAWVLFVGLAALAYRHMLGPEPLQGGALPEFPAGPSGFFQELLSGVRTTGLGGAQPASPALALLGGFSALTLASTTLAQKVLVALLPPLSAVTFYRAMSRRTGERGPAVLAAGCYGLSAVALWAFSEGRIPVLVMLAVLPPLSERLAVAFGARRPEHPWRFIVATGLVLAVGGAFYPGIALAFGVLFVAQLLFGARGGRRLRGIGLMVPSVAVAGALLFPSVIDAVQGEGAALTSRLVEADFAELARLAPGASPGSWTVAWFLPAAALLSFMLVEGDARRPAVRHLLVGAGAPFLAWGSAAGYLPDPVSNPPAYLAVAALSYCSLVGLGLASVLPGMGRRAFGYRQLGVVALSSLLTGGLFLQAVQTARADWEIGPDGLPPAWPVVQSPDPGTDYRILWVGRGTRTPFLAPGGDPEGTVAAGSTSIRYAVTDRVGLTALDTGRVSYGDGYGYTEQVLAQILSGTTHHGGALLAPLGVRFVVAAEGDLPRAVLDRLDRQVDLDLLPAGGLVIYSNPAALPPASVDRDGTLGEAAGRTELLAVASLAPTSVSPLRSVPGGYELTAPGDGGYVLIADQFDRGWRLEGSGRSIPAERAFGWAIGFPVDAGSGPLLVRYDDQWERTAQMLGLAVLWAAALWITRKPARRPARARERPARAEVVEVSEVSV